jgi:hypothetical protein
MILFQQIAEMLESGVISPIAHASNVNLAKKKRAA